MTDKKVLIDQTIERVKILLVTSRLAERNRVLSTPSRLVVPISPRTHSTSPYQHARHLPTEKKEPCIFNSSYSTRLHTPVSSHPIRSRHITSHVHLQSHCRRLVSSLADPPAWPSPGEAKPSVTPHRGCARKKKKIAPRLSYDEADAYHQEQNRLLYVSPPQEEV